MDVPNAILTYPSGINPAGEIVGGYIDSSGMWHGYLFSEGSYHSIDFPNAIATAVLGINPAGTIVGEYVDKFMSSMAVEAAGATGRGLEFGSKGR